MKMLRNIFKLVFVIIGALIGAGFASGQEIYVFFYSYGLNGIIGIIISSLLMGCIIYKTFKIMENNNISTYKEFLEVIIGEKKTKLIRILNTIINIFLLVTFFIMISGFGAYFEQQLGISSMIGSCILAILSYIIFMTSTKGIVKVSELIVPFLILFIMYIGFKVLGIIDISKINQYTINSNNGLEFFIKSILYSSYNSILLIPVLITLKEYLKNDEINKYVSILTSIIVMILSIVIFIILSKIDVNIENLEMPAVYLVSKLSKSLSIIYGFIILSSIFTTSISIGNSFIKNICENKKSYQHIAFIMCITSIIISKIGFSNLVQLLYPFFGYLGLIQIVKIILADKVKNKFLKNK